MVVTLTVIAITFTVSFFFRYFRSMFVKSKIEHLTMALSDISSGLECFGFLNVMKAKSNAFYHVFCPENIFHGIMIRLSRDLQPITLKVEVMIN